MRARRTTSIILGTAALAGAMIWGTRELSRPAYSGGAGITYGNAYAPVRDTELDFHIWYPAMPGGKTVTVGGNGVFFGTPAGRGAPHRPGKFPLITMSHGAGGNAGQFGWIAAELAEAGYVVVLPNHPGTTTGNASAEAAVRVWERPKDISAVLDEIESNPETYPFINMDKIGSLGFSAGGYTAMANSGARVDPDRLQQFCDTKDHGMSDCAFLEYFGIDLHAFDLSPAAQDLRDPRISAAAIIDPGIVSTLTDDSLADIQIPMMILNLGEESTVPAGVHAAAAAARIPGAEHNYIPGSVHFSFLAQCKARGPAILQNEGELDPLCDDAGQQTRGEIHRNLAGRIVTFFEDQF